MPTLLLLLALARTTAERKLADARCAIYPFDIGHHTDFHLPERYTPKNWLGNKFSAEYWLQIAMRRHPWRAPSAAAADLVLMEANFSMSCRAGKMFSGRFLWQKMNGVLALGEKKPKPGTPPPTLHPKLAGSEAVPKAYVLTDNECMPPWTGSRRLKGLIELTDQNPHGNDILAPFVLTKPWWLVGAARKPSDAAAPELVPWGQRKLLFFAGHVPKLYIAPTRYLIWRQTRRHPGVTAYSATLNCTIGSFSVCPRVVNISLAASRNYCSDFCASHVMDDYKTFLNDAPGHVRVRRSKNASAAAADGGAAEQTGAHMPKPKMGRCISGPKALQKTCKHYKHISWADELPDMAKSARNLPSAQYFANAMGHKFCVAAPGDFVSTPKITEYVAMGAAGGCLPLLVIKGAPERTLPYTRWLDWCKLAYIVSDAKAKTDMAAVLAKLDAVSAQEAAAKRRALLAVRDAFVWRPPAPVGPDGGPQQQPERPSAPDYLLGELCDAARSARANRTLSADSRPSFASCML